MISKTLLLLCVLWHGSFQVHAVPLQLLYEWDYIDYVWPDPLARISAVNLGQYNFTRPLLYDVAIHDDGRIFVTTVGHDGVPFSLSTVSNIMGDGGPLLQPYPDWSWGRRTDCKGLIDAVRLVIDQCNRLWIIDSGKIHNRRVCPAQLVAFDLTFNVPVYQRTIPDDIANGASGTGHLDAIIVLNNINPCLFIDQTVTYLTDYRGFALVVCTFLGCRRITSDSFLPNPTAEILTVAGQNFIAANGLSNLVQVGSTIYLTVEASYDLLSIEEWQVGLALLTGTIQPERYPNVFSSQVTGIALSQTGALFVGLTRETGIACLNSQQIQNAAQIVTGTDYCFQTILVQDPQNLQLISNLKVRTVNGDEYLYGVSNRLQKYLTNTMNFDEVNFRIFQIETASLLGPTHGGNVCVNSQTIMFK